MVAKRKLKKKVSIMILLLVTLTVAMFIVFCVLFYLNSKKTPIVENVDIAKDVNANNLVDVVITFKNKTDGYSCVASEEVINAESEGWKTFNKEKCSLELESGKYDLYLKNKDNEVKKVDSFEVKVDKIKSITLDKEKAYIVLKEKLELKTSIDKIGTPDETIEWTSSDDKIATVSDKGIVTGKKSGNVVITATTKNGIKDSVDVVVTNLIKLPAIRTMSYLPCNHYSAEEEKLLDEILAYKVANAGKGTRAGVVAAARFITIEFPYRLMYFSENGRLSGTGSAIVEGEGRYYKEGLYLTKSKGADFKYTMYGPEPWGCSMYSTPYGKNQMNGLDCSGFITWVLVNGGFDPGDIGAGLSGGKDLTDLGKLTRNSMDIVNNKMRAGDLLSQTVAGEHIAVVAGIDDNYVYVSESLWYDTYGVQTKRYSKSNMPSAFYYWVDMSDYYPEDGNYSEMW